LITIIIVLAVLCLLSLWYVNKHKLTLIHNKYIYNKVVQALLPLYHSFSRFIYKMPNLLYLPKMFGRVDIPEYQLEINPEDLRKLEENIPPAVVNGVFVGHSELNEEYQISVPAVFTYQNKKYKVKVSLRGDYENHWTDIKKSWQIEFDKENLFFGIETIKLILPYDRGYFSEYLNSYRAKKLGVILTEAQFVKFKINSQSYGVYYQFEDWSEGFLEKNRLPANSNFYVTDDDVINLDDNFSAFNSPVFWRKKLSARRYPYDNFSEMDFLLKLLQQENFSDVAPDIINLDSFYRWNILSILAGSQHQGGRGNSRLYFNNTSGKFEFVPWDLGIGEPVNDVVVDNLLTSKILSDPQREFERNRLLWNYLAVGNNLQDDLQVYDQIYNQLKPAFYREFKKYHNNIRFDQEVARIREEYINIYNTTKELFMTDNSAVVYLYVPKDRLIISGINVDNFAGLMFKAITFTSGNFSGALRIYRDDDHDNLLTASDSLLISRTISKNDTIIDLAPLNQFLFSHRQYNLENQQSQLTPQNYTFFIKLPSTPSSASNPELHFANAVTNEEVAIQNTQFINTENLFVYN